MPPFHDIKWDMSRVIFSNNKMLLTFYSYNKFDTIIVIIVIIVIMQSAPMLNAVMLSVMAPPLIFCRFLFTFSVLHLSAYISTICSIGQNASRQN